MSEAGKGDEIRKDDVPTPQLGEPGEHPLSVLLFSWMRTRGFYRGLMAVLAALGAVLIALEFVAPRRGYLPLEGIPGFFGVFGFVAFSLAVLSGWPLGKALRRPEDYYEPDIDRDAPVSTDATKTGDAKVEGGHDH